MDDIEELDDVGVVDLFEQRNFAYCSRGHAFILILKTDLLKRNDLKESEARRHTLPLVRSLALYTIP